MYLILRVLSTVALPIWSKWLDHVLVFKEVKLSNWTHTVCSWHFLGGLDLFCMFIYSLKCCKGRLLRRHSSSKVLWSITFILQYSRIGITLFMCAFVGVFVVFLGVCFVRRRQLWAGFSWYCRFLQFGFVLSDCMKCDQSTLLHCKCYFPRKNKQGLINARILHGTLKVSLTWLDVCGIARIVKWLGLTCFC